MRSFDWQARVYYEDTDAGGVVYHARYLAFYERARTEMLRQFGISQQSLLQLGTAFVVRKMDIDYISPAKLDDMLTIHSEVVQLKRASLVFQQQIVNQDHKLISQATVIIACVDMIKMKPCALPKSLVVEFV